MVTISFTRSSQREAAISREIIAGGIETPMTLRERERENNGRKGEEEEDFLSSGGGEMTKVSSILKRSRTIGVTRGVIRSVCINRPRGSDNLGYEATSNVRLIVRERCSFGLDRPRVVKPNQPATWLANLGLVKPRRLSLSLSLLFFREKMLNLQ